MLKYVGTGSEVTREIWEMKLLTPWPTLELGSSGTFGKNADHVILEVMVRSCARHLLFWEVDAVSLLHASAVRSAITEPLWSMVCMSLHVSQQLVLRRCVGESLD